MATDFTGLFKTPEQVRAEQLGALEARNAQIAGMGGSMSGLLGQVAAGRGAQLAQVTADIFGMKTAEEAQAAKRQQLLSSVDTTDPQSLAAGIEAAQAANLPQVAEYLQGKAASISAADRARLVEDRTYALDYAKTQSQLGVNQATIRKTLAEADKMDAMTPLEARIKQAEALVAEGTVTTKISQASANLAKTYADTLSVQTGTNKTEFEMQQLAQDMDYAAQLNPILLTQEGIKTQGMQLANDLDSLALQKGSALMPYEIAEKVLGNNLTAAQTEQVKVDTNAKLQEMALGPNPTAFMKELKHAAERNIVSDAEYDELLLQNLQAQSRTGGVSGFDIKGDAQKFAFDGYTGVIKAGQTASRPLELFQTYLASVENGAATGPLADVERWSMQLGAMFGIDDAEAKAAANDLVSVLQGANTLAEASALKGALSDKDLKFLQESLPNYRNSEQGLKDVLIYLASSKAGEVAAGQSFENRMAMDDFTGETVLKSKPKQSSTGIAAVNQYSYLVRQRAAGKYSGPIPIPTAGEIASWAQFTKQPAGAAESLIETIKLREERK